MTTDMETIDEIKRKVIEEISKEYILVRKPKSGCGCLSHAKSESEKKYQTGSPPKLDSEVADGQDGEGEDELVSSPRSSWKVDEDIYEPVFNDVPPPDVIPLPQPVVYKKLVELIEGIYKVAESCTEIEKFCDNVTEKFNNNADRAIGNVQIANFNYTAIVTAIRSLGGVCECKPENENFEKLENVEKIKRIEGNDHEPTYPEVEIPDS